MRILFILQIFIFFTFAANEVDKYHEIATKLDKIYHEPKCLQELRNIFQIPYFLISHHGIKKLENKEKIEKFIKELFEDKINSKREILDVKLEKRFGGRLTYTVRETETGKNLHFLAKPDKNENGEYKLVMQKSIDL
ncbi:unnamed protein product [Caenorhabditis angaria]|uniref:DUF38 domain-containing protein n=1 Tax=Caenorhabditis angaria TaxID=860376 RepID=A0A9P1I6P5_9PELO|nr:unnamed protein product [Caenorhabditis angaria]